MKYFNVPADFKFETIDEYDRLNNLYEDAQIKETYGQLTINNIFGSGRPSDLIPKVDLNKLEKYVAYSRKRNIDFNYTLNATCLGNLEFSEAGLTKIDRFLGDIYDIGVKSLTVAIPSLIEYVHMSKYDFIIKASVLCEILNANKAMSYKKIGAQRIVLYETINREFDTIKRIRNAFGQYVEVIVNVICHKNCIYRPFHQNQCAHDIDPESPSVTYYTHRCMIKRIEELNNLLKLNWIRPEDLKYYTSIGVEYFKLQGRHTILKGDPVRTVESYMKESFDGNFMDLLDYFAPTNSFQIYLDNKKLDGYIEPFLKNPDFCKNDCEKCNYCENYIKKALDYEKSTEVYKVAREFYSQYDHFINMAKRVNQTQNTPREKIDQPDLNIEESMDFNF